MFPDPPIPSLYTHGPRFAMVLCTAIQLIHFPCISPCYFEFLVCRCTMMGRWRPCPLILFPGDSLCLSPPSQRAAVCRPTHAATGGVARGCRPVHGGPQRHVAGPAAAGAGTAGPEHDVHQHSRVSGATGCWMETVKSHECGPGVVSACGGKPHIHGGSEGLQNPSPWLAFALVLDTLRAAGY